MATQRQQRALSQQLTWIGTVEHLAASYGKPELAATLHAFGEEVQAGTLTYKNSLSEDDEPDVVEGPSKEAP